mmetsp:Transcript_12810/g.26981  ORF Transcript_12810/g.26981 Transcript_12810/m.26981 type:complete len:96 (+) Transcript_12810:2831-3118(+)
MTRTVHHISITHLPILSNFLHCSTNVGWDGMGFDVTSDVITKGHASMVRTGTVIVEFRFRLGSRDRAFNRNVQYSWRVFGVRVCIVVFQKIQEKK